MKTIYLLKGLPASGKSTWARNKQEEDSNIVRVNKDDLRSMLHNSKWSKHNEKQILRIRNQVVEDSLSNGRHVIVDDTNLHPKHEIHMKQIAKKHNAKVDVVDFNISVEECIKRDLKRANSVGEKVITRMHKQFIAEKTENKPLNPLIFDEVLPDCVIFDLDGTLAMIGDRSPYDGKSCAVDKPNESIVHLKNFIESGRDDGYMSGTNIVIFSGRNGDSEVETRDWLKTHGVEPDALFMRKEGDSRNDSIVKKEMFDEYIKDKYNVLFVVDDRDQVVKMWRSLGITCLQVNYGDF